MRYSAESFWEKFSRQFQGERPGNGSIRPAEGPQGEGSGKAGSDAKNSARFASNAGAPNPFAALQRTTFHRKTTENLITPCKAKPRTELSGVLCVLGRYFPLTRRIHGSCRVPQRGEGRRADLCPAACSRGERGDEQTSALLRGEKGESARSVPRVGVRKAGESPVLLTASAGLSGRGGCRTAASDAAAATRWQGRRPHRSWRRQRAPFARRAARRP